MTGYHDSCKPKLEYYDKVWYCTCIKCNNKNDDNDTKTQGDGNEQPSTEVLLETNSEE